MKVVILCGGRGTRLREETEYRPKPMVPIGTQPILWHIMKIYASQGHKDFILCLGYKGEMIKNFFRNYHWMMSDVTLKLGQKPNVRFNGRHDEEDWTVTLADTGEMTMTGARVARAAAKYLGNATNFAVTYGDGLTDANLAEELEFHLAQKRYGTVLGVNPPSRFGELKVDGAQVQEFAEKPKFVENWINGGFFFFHRNFLPYLSAEESCVLEREPLVKLAQDGQLSIFKHRGFWACVDTQRDREYLEKLWASGKPPWVV